MNRSPITVTILVLGLVGTTALADGVGSSDAQIRKVAYPILDNILNGMAKAHFEAYVRDFDETDDDVLIKLVLSEKGDKTEVGGLWFQ